MTRSCGSFAASACTCRDALSESTGKSFACRLQLAVGVNSSPKEGAGALGDAVGGRLGGLHRAARDQETVVCELATEGWDVASPFRIGLHFEHEPVRSSRCRRGAARARPLPATPRAGTREHGNALPAGGSLTPGRDH